MKPKCISFIEKMAYRTGITQYISVCINWWKNPFHFKQWLFICIQTKWQFCIAVDLRLQQPRRSVYIQLLSISVEICFESMESGQKRYADRLEKETWPGEI